MATKNPLKPYTDLIEEFIKDLDGLTSLIEIAKTDSEKYLVGCLTIGKLSAWMLVFASLLAQMYGWDKTIRE